MCEASAVTIRRIRPQDYQALIALWKRSGLSFRPTGRDRYESIIEQVKVFGDLYLLAECDGKVVGSVMGAHDSRKGWINRLAVDPDCQRKGIARKLVAECEARLCAEGIEIIAVLVEEDNETSCRFFESCDYLADVPVRYYRKRFRNDI